MKDATRIAQTLWLDGIVIGGVLRSELAGSKLVQIGVSLLAEMVK